MITARLNQDVDDISVLIHGTPEVLPLTIDRDKEFIQMLGIAEATLSSLQSPSIIRTELLTPLSDSLVRDDDSAFGKKIFDIAKTQTEAVVNPDGMTDDVRRKPVSVVAVSAGFHPFSLAVLG